MSRMAAILGAVLFAAATLLSAYVGAGPVASSLAEPAQLTGAINKEPEPASPGCPPGEHPYLWDNSICQINCPPGQVNAWPFLGGYCMTPDNTCYNRRDDPGGGYHCGSYGYRYRESRRQFDVAAS